MASPKLSAQLTVPTENDSTSDPEDPSASSNSLEELWSPSAVSVFFSSWTIYNSAEAFKPRAPRKYVVQDLLPQPGLVMAFGRSGDQKSLLLLDLCVCVATGIEWLPATQSDRAHKPRKTIQSRVLWLDFDNGKQVMDERMESLLRGHQLPKSIPLDYVTVPDEWLDISQAVSVRNLAQLIRAYEYRLIVIDNLGAIEGGVDENSSKMSQIMGRLRWAVQYTGSTVILVHHPHKDYGQTTNLADLSRGHSSINAALDVSLLIERDPADRARLVIRSAKSRGNDIVTFGARLHYTHRIGTEELRTAYYSGHVIEDRGSVLAARNRILERIASSGPTNQNALVNELRNTTSRSRIFAILNKMEAEGALIVGKGAHGSKIYSLPTSLQLDPRMALIRQLLTMAPETD